MKIRYFLLLLLPALPTAASVAQESCRVLLKSIEGGYNGDCKNGLAHGRGTATGTDTYTGMFRKGLPEGYGVYTYAGGDTFEGRWKAGKQEGEGKFTHRVNGHDSIVTGLWREGKYIGKAVERPEIKSKQNITDVRFTRLGDGNTVTLVFTMAGTYNYSLRGLVIEPNNGSVIRLGNDQKIRDIVFPFSCKVSYESNNQLRTAVFPCSLDFTITEPGEWEVRVENN